MRLRLFLKARGYMRRDSVSRMARRPAALSGIFAFMLMAALGGSSEDVGLLPKFIEDVPNITVTVGRDALLPCTVEQLKGFKVAWVQVDTQTILTIHKQVITRNPRVALLHNDHRTWHLQIKNVREIDRGWYMCQVNTDPMRFRQGYVDVVVPPDIIDRESSGDLTIREGQDVTLTCRARGHPPPTIVWRREDNQDIFPDPGTTGRDVSGSTSPAPDAGVTGTASHDVGIARAQSRGSDLLGVPRRGVGGATRVVEGETLVLKKVSRLQMGSYLCIASNGIPPSISKRAHLRVQFPPMAWVPHQLEGAYVGQDLSIECQTEAFPTSINYWTNNKGEMIVVGERYEPGLAESSYKVYMRLRIRRVTQDDFGTFRCVAKNSLGETDGAIRIYEIEAPKAQVNGRSEVGEDEVEESSGDQATTTPTTTKKDHKKYQNLLHPKGINDLTDEQQLDKSYGAKGPEHHDQTPLQGQRPGESPDHRDHSDGSSGGSGGVVSCQVVLPVVAAMTLFLLHPAVPIV